jgi:hypothetical protein
MLRLCAEFCRVAEKVQDLNAVHARTVYEVLHAWETRRFDEAIEKVEPLRSTYSGWDSAMVYSLSLARRHHETRILLDDLCNSRKMREPWDLNWLCLMIDRADACAQIGDLEVARALYRELLPHRSQISIVGYGFGFWGSVERVLGVLAAMDRRWTAAEEHFQAALGTHRRLGARALAARTQWGYARMLRERNSPGDHERAKQMIGEAMRDARALGMTTLIDQLESLSAELPEH